MTPITLKYKPKFLPQISAPYTEVVNSLLSDGINHEISTLNPNDLKVIQGITLSHNVNNANLDDENPIWISKDFEVLDGLHRMVKAINQNRLVRCVKIDLPAKDACRVLNKIQDLYDHTKKTTEDNENNMDFLDRISQVNDVSEDNTEKETVKVIAYRKEPIKPNSVVGNFFSLTPSSTAKKYEIEFDNPLNTDSLGISFVDGQIPVDILSKIWFPHINFEKVATDNNTEPIKVQNRAVAEKAKKMGYDGIIYGDKLVQGF